MAEREFSSLTSFITHLAAAEIAIHKAEKHALKKVALIIEKNAKDRIGQYQEQEGPFNKWADLADSTEAEKARLGYPSDAPLLRTGDLRDTIQHEIDDHLVDMSAVIGSKSDIAAYQEFGTDKIPPRPFIGPAAFSQKDKIQRILGEAFVEGLVGGEVIHQALGYDFET